MKGFIKNEQFIGFEKVISLSSSLVFKLSFGNTSNLSVTIAFTKYTLFPLYFSYYPPY